MKQITSASDIKSLGTLMTIFAHPDDETYMCAGLLSTAIKNGQKVICITATRGELGIQDESRWPASKLGEIRTKEMKLALSLIGVTNHHWLGYGDGQCASVSTSDAIDKIQDYITKYQPDTILTFGPDGLTGHPDHRTVSKWTSMAVNDSNKEIQIYHVVQPKETYNIMQKADDKFDIFFNIDNPPIADQSECDIYFNLPKYCSDIKFNALEAMTSQTSAMIEHFGKEYMCKMTNIEAFMRVD